MNEVICHGIPDDRPLEDGDIVNVDITAYIGGVHGDCSATFYAGEPDPDSRRLVEVTRECRDLGIAAVRPGRPVSDIGRAIEAHAKSHGYGVVRTFVGHGIGEQFHLPPNVPHYYTASASTIMEPGMTFTSRADDHDGHLAGADVGQRLDGGHRGWPAYRSVRAHPPRDRRWIRDPDARLLSLEPRVQAFELER